MNSPEPTTKEPEKRKSTTPEKEKPEEEQEVSALSEMMCSLVTNNDGETRYIGEPWYVIRVLSPLLTLPKALRPDFLSSRQRVCSGSTRRWATALSSR